VSERVAATPMAARVAMRVYFTVFPRSSAVHAVRSICISHRVTGDPP
jgi:hypothetical protein